ncbi:hypothetical protein [Prescottella subtropica]|uniref:hypothetical protein n=1 Tax=Prescottella subtropica TaxID=2545757 RepID=UPI0010F86B82|nr:hypothetical protein [Prescottella subtropica]
MEPAVDRWEIGREYPTWDQTVALAQLLGVRVRDLTHLDADPKRETRPRMRLPGMAILSFDPEAVAATTGTSSA